MSVTARYRALVAVGKVAYDAAQEDAAARLSDLAERIKDWSPHLGSKLKKRSGPGEVGIYLFGAVGRGKSMLMDLFFQSAQVEAKRRVHFHAFMQEVHARVNAAKARKNNKGDPLPRIAKAIAAEHWLLCFDEFQVTDIADAMILRRLFEHLFERGVVLVATSNVQPDDLYKDGINRQEVLPFIALLKERVELIGLDAKRDYRQGRADAAQVWFTPLGPDADARMDEAWRAQLAGEPERAEALEVLGRRVPVPRAGAGAARFSYEALCATALGPADYLALAARYRTLFLDRIPMLGPEKRDEAKRLVTLIDALYEAKVKLVASAAGAPEAIYPAGDAAFEFERAASRLAEMRSKKYLESRGI